MFDQTSSRASSEAILRAENASLSMRHSGAAGGRRDDAALPSRAEGPSGLPLPRFVTTRSEPINVRVGPGTRYDIAWVYVKAGTPVEIIQEFDTWRKIRDVDGSEGWLHQNLLQGKRAGLVAPWKSPDEQVALRRSAERDARTSAPGWRRISASTSGNATAPGARSSPPRARPAAARAASTATCRRTNSGACTRANSSTEGRSRPSSMGPRVKPGDDGGCRT